MDEQNHPASRSGDYANDIEEMHFGGSTSEDDDDEPRLRIDTSEDEEENVLDNSSLSSSFSRRKPSSTSRLKTTVGSRGAPSTKKFDAKNTNPLQSLQQLVHSPFLNAQISAADGGINQGCKMNPLAKENRSKSNCDAQSLAAAAEALRNIFSHNANGGGGISNMAINNWDALPTPKPNSGSGAKSKKSSSAAKRNSTNFQRLSPVSIEVVPSLSHLLPLSQHSPPSPQMPKQQSDSNGNKSGSAGGRGKATNSNRLNYIVSKLQRSATEEEHLRQLQQLQSSPEAENFKMFQQFLKSGQFQTRCNNNNLEILPAAATAPAAPNTINLSNSKGFRYASSSAQTRPTFSFQTTTPLPPPPPLTFQSTPEFSNPTNRMDFRMPPTLTVIPKNTGNGNSGKKTNCRRSPPPMVPIESIANFRKPLNEDNVVYRLKKLGTDIELEKNTAASRDDSAPAEIEDVAAKAAPAPVTNNNSSNVSDKASLPFLKPIPIGERSANDLRNLAKLHPPPPSLIPIKPVTQLVPILPSLPQSTISEVPIKLKKTSKGRVPSFVSILPKVNVNQNDVLDMAAKIRMNASSGDKVDGSQFMFGKGSPSDVIFTRKEDMPGGFNQSNIDFSQLRLSAPKATKKKKRNRLSAKSEYTKLAHALVQAATPLPKKDDIDRPVIVPIRNEMPPKELDFDNVEGEIITIEPILMPQSRRESEEPFVNDAPSDHEDEFIHVPDNSSPRPETSTPTLPSMTPWSSGAPDDKGYFLFSPTQAIQVGVLPNGRKMLSCDICSGVYHKMFSLKKHYYRNHINPKFIWAKHADMFKVPPISSSLAVNPKSNRSMYFCSICECLFDEKAELSSHLTDHPPLTLENTNKNNSKLYVCPTCNTVFSKKRTQVRHSKKCAKLYETAGISAPTPPAKEPAADLPPSDDEAQDDNATEETNSTTSSKNEDVLEIDEIPSTSKNSKLETSMMCLFCELSFTDTTKRKKHVLQHHHPKRKQQPCVYCKNKTFSDLSDLLKHICEMHSKRYFGCAICKIRFRTKEDLVAHNAESHDGVVADADKEPIVEEKVTKVATVSNKNGKNYKCNQCPKVFINTVELGRHRKAAHRESSRNNVKKVVSAFSGSIDSNEQKYRSTIITTADYETEFYRNVCHNVKYNLENCMEGRIEMKKEENPPQDENDPRYADLPGGIEGGKEKSESLSFQDLYGTENIDSRFIQNVSRLHLETQLTMLRKANLLDKELDGPLRTKTSAAGRNSSIASHLALAEKSDGERAGDEAKNENDGANEIVFTGEWIRSRNYICGTCFARFNNFWDMDTHRWSRHPNVYGFYYEFVAEQTPGKNWAMKRSLLNHGSLGVTSSQNLPSSSTCTKCQKSFSPVSEFHKHILECGGDTTWTSMMFAAHTKRNKKWRPYGSRRRKNIARHRGLKRNIPTTPVKIIGPPRNRQKAGDTETIQRMIANLPPKRITRRVITFDDLDARPKGRFSNNSSSQSNILTRKRKESMDIKNSAASRSQQQQQQQQQHGDSKQNVTTSTTLIGTKNNTPYNSNRTVSTSKSHSKQTTTNATSVKETIPVREEAKRSEVVPDTSSASSSTTSSKNETIETEIKEEIAPEPQVSSIKVSTSKGGKTVKIIQARDVENISIKSPAPVTTSSQSESDTNAKSKPIERETVTESKLPTKTKSVVEEGGSTVVKITTSWKNQMSSGEPVSIRKLRSTDESSAEKMESASESKTNSSCDERIANSVTKTEPKSNSEICSTLELRSTTGSRNKSLVIQVQDDGKPKNEPVTIIRSDKKKKKRCTPITSKRLAPEIPTPSPVTAKKSENLPSSGEKSVPESTPEVTIEKPENLPVEVEKLVPEIAEVSTEKPEDTQVAPEKSASVTEPKVMTETPVDPPETPEMPEKLEPETAPQLTVENPDNDEPAKLEKMTPVMPPEITSTENSNDSSVPKEESIPEMPPVLVKETMHKEVATETMHKEVATETMHKEVTTETMHKEVASKTETEIKTEAKEEPITSDAAVNSVATESQTEPEDSPKEVVNAVAVTTDKPVAESEEGEIDLSAIEPADEDGPLLPDTSVILAAMKETMRQTDAVISSMPITTNAGKKRKREEPAKCKKCGVKVEASANTTLICEGCTETPVKKSKPAASPVSKIEMFTCKTCHVSIPKNISAGNDETCDKCVAAAAAVVAAVVPVVAATPATAAVTATVPAAAIATAAATVAVKNDKPSPKKCSPKLKDTRIPPPPPFRCRKCDSIGLAPLDGSMFCDKCSRLQETVCLLCQSSYISDTNDKVCGKCMLAGSSKQKKRIVETDAPAIVTNIVTCNISEKKSLHCDVCKNATKCTCKRRTSGQLDRAATAEVACDSCGKMWKDEDNSSSSTCRMCRASRTPTKGDAARIPERNESIKCTDCGIVVVPISSEAAMQKLCDGCLMRRNERRPSNEIRYLDTAKSVARTGPSIQRSPNVFSGFAAAADDKVRNKIDEMKGNHHKEEERSAQVSALTSSPVSSTEHKTPMKNVKLICRGCYGVFDTVSSYKYHCDNCKHRNNDKKPLLSFAKRNTKTGAESTSQAEPNNGASFEILEGVQIKYVEMAGSSQSDKVEAGRETSQVPLVVYESDSSPMKKSDSSRSLKKHKRTHSSPETIMDTIESVIKSVCYDNVDPSLTFDSNNDDSDYHEKTPVKDVTSNENQQAEKSADDSSPNVSVSEKSTCNENTTVDLKTEPKKNEDDSSEEEPTIKTPKSKSSKKKASKRRKPAAKKSRKSDSTAETEKTSAADDDVDKKENPEAKGKQPTKKESIVAEDESRMDDAEKQSKKSSTNQVATSNDVEPRRTRRRACTAAVPAGRALRSRTKFYESLNDLKSYDDMEETKSEPEPMDVDQTSTSSSLPLEDSEKSTPTPRGAAKKRKSESNKNDAKKSKTESNNDLGFAVTKTNKTIPKNAKKNSSNDSKNFEQLDDEVESSSSPSANQTVSNDRPIVTRKTSDTSESSITTTGVLAPVTDTPLDSAKRRRSSEISINDQGSKYSSPSATPSNENGSRRNSTATVISSTGEFQNEHARSFFDEAQGLESGSEYADGPSSKNATPTYGYDELNGNSFPEPYDSTEGTSHNSSPSYSNAWDFFGQKSLGSIIDTMNEILSRPEVSSCSSETVELFREEMMMFQHFGREISAIDKQEEESKQDEETTTIIDLDEISRKSDDKSKSKTKSDASCSNTNTFSEECGICDQTFSEPNAALSHMSSAHHIGNTNKNIKDSKLKQNNKSNQNGMKTNTKHKCSHCQKVLQNQHEALAHMKEHWKSFISSKNSDNSSHLKNSIAGKLEELLLDKALMNYLKSPQETQNRNSLPLKILNQISLAKKNQFTNWKSALAQMLDVDTANSSPPTTASGPASPVEPALPPAPVETKPEEKTKTQATETPNPELVDNYPNGYPCPMCNKTFQYTRLRNTHLIMVHAPRQSTHKHLIEGKNNSKKGEKNKSSNENRNSNARSSSTRGKVIQSYLLNDSVNTVKKSDSQDNSSSPSAKTARPTSTSSSTAVTGSKNTKKQEKRTATSKSTPAVSVAPPSSSSSTTATTTVTAATSTTTSTPTTTSAKPNPTTNTPAKLSGNDDDQSNAKKKKPCRKKMSKKEMNLPAAIVKMKAEQALLQLCNSRFNRICSQT